MAPSRLPMRVVLLVMLFLFTGLVPFSVFGQGVPVPIDVGEVRTGEVSAADIAPSFIYAASDAQAINVVVEAQTPQFSPALRVLNASGELLEDIPNPGNFQRLDTVVLLPQAGPFVLQVYSASGFGGQFTITIPDALPVPESLAEGQVLEVLLSPANPVVRFAFEANPLTPLVLMVETDTPVAAVGALTGEAGDELARASLLLTGFDLDIPPGSGSYILSLFQSVDSAQETVRVALVPPQQVIAPTQIAPTPLPQPTPIPLLPLPSTGPCVVASFSGGRVNLRSGPSTDFEVVNQLSGNETALVTGRLADSSWFQVSFEGEIAWVANFVVRQGGECGGVPVVPAPGVPVPPTQPPAAGPGAADLAIAGISVTPGNPLEDTQFAVNVTVTNVGSAAATNVPVRIAFSSPDVLVSAPATETTIPTIPPQSAVTVNFTGIRGDRGGVINGQILVDPTNIVPEINEGNNSAGFQVNVVSGDPDLPDLTIPDIDMETTPGSSQVRVRVFVANEGEGDAGPFQVAVNFNPATVPQQILSFDGVEDDDTVSRAFNIDLGSTGNYTVNATADFNNAIAEENEVNNTGTESFNVGG